MKVQGLLPIGYQLLRGHDRFVTLPPRTAQAIMSDRSVTVGDTGLHTALNAAAHCPLPVLQ
jgi:hypothetical protein